MRLWRSLKATGAGTLREGVYLLPGHAPGARTLAELERTLVEAGAQAHLLVVQARDDAQEQTFRALFDRSERHAAFLQAVDEVRAQLGSGAAVALRRALRALDAEWQALQAQDFFPDHHAERSAAALAALRQAVERLLSPDEPSAR